MKHHLSQENLSKKAKAPLEHTGSTTENPETRFQIERSGKAWPRRWYFRRTWLKYKSEPGRYLGELFSKETSSRTLREEPVVYNRGTVKKPARLEWGEGGRKLLFPIQCLKEELLKYKNSIIHDYTSIFTHQKVLILYVSPYFPTYIPSHLFTCFALSAASYCCWCQTSLNSLLSNIGRVLCFIKLSIYGTFGPMFAHGVLNTFHSNSEARRKMSTSFWECGRRCQVKQGLTMYVNLRMIILASS